MGIRIFWDDDEKTVIRYEFEESWTWEDLIAAVQKDDELMAEVDHTVHLILDMRAIRDVPSNPMGHLRSIAGMVSPQLGLVIFVGTNRWAQALVEIFYKVYKSQVKGMSGVAVVATLDEAYAAIAQYKSRVN